MHDNLTRRQALGLAAGAAAVSALPGFASAAQTAYPTNNLGMPLMPLKIVNNSGLTAPIYIWLYGTIEGANQPYYWMSDFNGNVTETVPDTKDEAYGLQLSGTTLNTFFPKMVGVRIYVSIGKPLKAAIPANGNPVTPEGHNTGSANYNTPFDFTEISWTGDVNGTSTLGGNVSAVDAFGLALSLKRKGYDPAQPANPTSVLTGFTSPTARQDIINGIKAAGEPWSGLILYGSDGSPLRVLQPNFGIFQGFPSDQLAAYVDELLQYYTTNTMSVNTTAGNTAGYVGHADQVKRTFIFSPPSGKTGEVYTLPAPTTTQLYRNTVEVSPNDGDGGALAAAFAASILRSTLGATGNNVVAVPQTNRSLYYQQSPVFEYSKVIHANAYGKHAFCFGYDEVAGDSGNPTVVNPTGMTLTLLPL